MSETSRLQLENMMCEFCAETIERAVQSLPGVSKCEVDMATKQVTIQHNSERVNLERIQQALAKVGYKSQPLTSTLP
ncbi:Heavy metal transport/detoxification protein (plasmid) [Stanieria cyanosphaera PCC 7437]|uniref:Copper chaperone CopZ n=1 Tax=Stanieria cyanosphaera (strain ATCC 29371 / PCC 7437) TaxID=111780 RepID=K9Y2G9_STAC7|nr:heavy metal-associated domain-containing protein [Stanieria cyanosphaera]AFZ38207.1 Heavy metal transport/detoxification protein [Stanieria cyanosphaera PCC 7437]